MAGMHLNTCKSLQECRNGNLEKFLTAHIIVSSVGGKASTRMQPIEPTDIAVKRGIGLEAASHKLECTTQRGLWTVLHPSLSHRFLTNYRQLQYRRRRHYVFGNNLLAGTKSKCGNKYAEVFVIEFGWSCEFPMAKKGDAHKALSLLFQQDGVPPKIIVDGSKE